MNYNNYIDSFSAIDWDKFKDSVIDSIDSEIASSSDDYILNVNEDDFVTYLVDKHYIEPLSIDSNSEGIETPWEIRENMSHYGGIYTIYERYLEGYSIEISYSYAGTACCLVFYQLHIN